MGIRKNELSHARLRIPLIVMLSIKTRIARGQSSAPNRGLTLNEAL